MDEQDLETRLRAYHPANPPDALRAWVIQRAAESLALSNRDRRALAWLPAVAALLLATIFYWLAANERQILDARFPAISPIEQQTIGMEFPQ